MKSFDSANYEPTMDMPNSNTTHGDAKLSDKDFRRLSDFIHKQCGISIPLSKRAILSARLQKRLQVLGLHSLTEYVDWIIDSFESGGELLSFIDLLTARKTGFFQNPEHFEFLAQVAIPDLIKNFGAGVGRELMVWSAGCSSGEEPYTLAIVLKEFSAHYPGINLKANVLATDVSAQVLEKANQGIYDMGKVDDLSLVLKQKYLLKSKDRQRRQVRVNPDVRSMVKFRRLNFMDSDFGLREKMDVIFCRDVLVYFDRPTQEKYINKFCQFLQPGGFIFLGISETMDGLNVALNRVAPAVYRQPF